MLFYLHVVCLDELNFMDKNEVYVGTFPNGYVR